MAKSVKKNNTFGVLNNLPDPTPTPTYTDTHTHTPTPIVKERKTRRVQLLLKESTVDALDAYAKIHKIILFTFLSLFPLLENNLTIPLIKLILFTFYKLINSFFYSIYFSTSRFEQIIYCYKKYWRIS